MADVPIPTLNGSDLVSEVDDQFRDLVDWIGNALALDTSGLVTLLSPARVGTMSALSNALLAAVGNANAVEWGHSNTAGYRCTLGSESGTGQPFIAFNAEAGTTTNTYRTRGKKGIVFRSNLDGTLTIGIVPGTNANNQALTEVLTISASTFSVATSLSFGASNDRPFQGLVAGAVTATGVADGSGFTSSKTSTGVYQITFSTAFPTRPIPVASPQSGGAATLAPQVGSIFATGFVVRTFDAAGSPADQPFTFIATPR